MDKPRLVVRLAVALIAFIIGITSTLLFNYFWPASRLSQPAVRRVIVTRLTESPHALAPCSGHSVTMQPAFEWTPAEPPAPPVPPVAPQPPARPHLRRGSN
ncbi:MAG TPA: hypothetical protein VE821_01945 [Pyrinomonadaceae bacterium]|nr:hypothetical protein [Pyrinomonadaceae bacterium]